MSADMYDYIIVGGGLSGCVVASRLREYDETANILLIEAGPDTRSRPDILDMQLLNLGGDLDWQYQCEPVAGLMGKKIIYNQGKGLGGDTVINSGKLQYYLQPSMATRTLTQVIRRRLDSRRGGRLR